MSDQPDTIEIRRLEVSAHIGVPDAERATPQSLWITTRMVQAQGFNGLGDSIEHTVDYQAVADQIEVLVGSRPRKLIETLAVEIADQLLHSHPLTKISVRIEKQILPRTDCVAVEVTRVR